MYTYTIAMSIENIGRYSVLTYDNGDMDFGDELEAARSAKGLSQEALGKLVGVTRAAVSHWEKGVTRPTGKRLDKLKEVLAWSEDALDGPQSTLANASVVKEIDGRASAGAGALVEYDDTLASWGFPELWVNSELRARPDDLRIITIEGDSGVSDPPVWNDLMPGDKVVIHTRDTTPSPPGYFLVHDGFGLVAKRVSIQHGKSEPTILLTSNNKAYAPYELTADEARIVGRVVGRWQRL